MHFGEHNCVVALGIGLDGTKHPLALVEGSTENATLVTDLIVGWRERGLDVTRPILAVLDGSKALRRAVVDATRPVRPCLVTGSPNTASSPRAQQRPGPYRQARSGARHDCPPTGIRPDEANTS